MKSQILYCPFQHYYEIKSGRDGDDVCAIFVYNRQERDGSGLWLVSSLKVYIVSNSMVRKMLLGLYYCVYNSSSQIGKGNNPAA